MQKAYQRITWQNLPSRTSALDADNLNAESAALDEIDDRVVTFDTTKANQTDMLQTISGIAFDRETGIFTITRYNGTSFTIDTDLEKIAVNFDYDDDPTSPHYQNLVLTLIDGTVKYIDLSALITQYEFTDSSQIHFSVGSDGKVTAEVINGSITENKLEPNFLANCRLEVDKAEGYADESSAWATGERDGAPVPTTDPAYNNNAKYYSIHAREEAEAWANGTRSDVPIGPSDPAFDKYAKYWAEKAHDDAEAWAVGQRSGVDVPPTDETYHNNSKYYSEQSDIRATDSEAWGVGQRNGVDVADGDPCYHNNSKYYSDQSNVHADESHQYRNEAEDILGQINQKIQASVFTVNFLTGNLEYTNEASYLFSINENTGNLEWEVA